MGKKISTRNLRNFFILMAIELNQISNGVSPLALEVDVGVALVQASLGDRDVGVLAGAELVQDLDAGDVEALDGRVRRVGHVTVVYAEQALGDVNLLGVQEPGEKNFVFLQLFEQSATMINTLHDYSGGREFDCQ